MLTIAMIFLASYTVCPWSWSDEGPITLGSNNRRGSHLSLTKRCVRVTADGGSSRPINYTMQAQLTLARISLAGYSVWPLFWCDEVPLNLSSSNRRGSHLSLCKRCLRLKADRGSSRPINYTCCPLLTFVYRTWSDGGHVFPGSSLVCGI